MDLKHILPPTISEVIERAGISTTKQIILLSVWDIKKVIKLKTEDIMLMKDLVADHLSPRCITCDELIVQESKIKRISTGCEDIDKILGGGFRPGTLTEIYGESGSGKSQLAILSAACNWSTGAVFICTEDLFPVKRLEQVKLSIPDYDPEQDYGKNIFVEHITEGTDLLSCVRVRLPKLLSNNKLSLVVLDSVAAPFRTETTNYIQRAEDLRELAMSLISVAQEHNLAVLCINQVTAAMDHTATLNNNTVLPSLGLAWSNMISTRLWLKKTNRLYKTRNIPSGSKTKVPCLEDNVFIRELSVIFAPDLPNTVANFIITPIGIQCIKEK